MRVMGEIASTGVAVTSGCREGKRKRREGTRQRSDGVRKGRESRVQDKSKKRITITCLCGRVPTVASCQ